jgi:hypothetical protein
MNGINANMNGNMNSLNTVHSGNSMNYSNSSNNILSNNVDNCSNIDVQNHSLFSNVIQRNANSNNNNSNSGNNSKATEGVKPAISAAYNSFHNPHSL